MNNNKYEINSNKYTDCMNESPYSQIHWKSNKIKK